MVTRSYAQLKEDEITEDLSGWDSSESDLITKNMEDKSHKVLYWDNVIKSTYQSSENKTKNNLKVFPFL